MRMLFIQNLRNAATLNDLSLECESLIEYSPQRKRTPHFSWIKHCKSKCTHFSVIGSKLGNSNIHNPSNTPSNESKLPFEA